MFVVFDYDVGFECVDDVFWCGSYYEGMVYEIDGSDVVEV